MVCLKLSNIFLNKIAGKLFVQPVGTSERIIAGGSKIVYECVVLGVDLKLATIATFFVVPAVAFPFIRSFDDAAADAVFYGSIGAYAASIVYSAKMIIPPVVILRTLYSLNKGTIKILKV